MLLTASTIQQAVGCSAATAQLWAKPLSDACALYAISTPKRLAAFVAQVGHESASLKKLVENLNYGAQGLADTWPSRYAVNPNARPRVPNQLARALERKPQAIANNAYANRMGNGPESSGDGWKHRGRGPIQNTGKANHAGTRSIRITVSVAWWWRWYAASIALASCFTGLPPNMDQVAHWARRSVRLRVEH